ncbi:hypothetical protein H4R26_004180 [Coemansia thaxteri]|uniref:Uncharacterized protein n=1 Tax=Coemansia thaxteri TaxID=2663907 RepID=A0A9W8EDW1_9FUNG|nr:hypothetical protein H4R26_004180 [Coemansia thaxteri]KAJ2482659.1 hypothetical protein EV174_003150 [Coemansia sp. RSA 2320]
MSDEPVLPHGQSGAQALGVGLSEAEVNSVPVEESPQTFEEHYEALPPVQVPHPVHTFIGPVILSLVLFSMAGVLVRVHLNRLFTYAGAPVYGLIWVQMLGCFVMGAAMRLKGVLLSYSPALNVGITTGLCGSITTFSSWQLLTFQMFFNTQREQHTRFDNFLGGMSVLVTTLCCSVAATRFGQMVGDEMRIACNYFRQRLAPAGVTVSKFDTAVLHGKIAGRRDGWLAWDRWRHMDIALAVGGFAGIIAAVLVVALAPHTRSVSIALLFGPVGTLLRWKLASLNTDRKRLGRYVPPIFAGLPLGTLIANLLGSAALAIVHILQTGAVVRPSVASCYVLVAVADGFCGCLTTVSTFAAEITVMQSRRSMLYAGTSIVAAQAFFILISGIYFETSTVDYPVC